MPGRGPLILIAVAAVLWPARSSMAAALTEWDFTAGPQGWTDEAGSRPDLNGRGACWPGSAVGLSLRSPALRLTTRAFQSLELTASCEAAGGAQLLWHGTAFGRPQPTWQGPMPVQVPADGQVHELTLLPFWQNVPVVEGLRLVAPPGTRLRLQRLRIVGPSAEAVDQAVWDLRDLLRAGQWLSLAGGASLRPQPDGLQVLLQEPATTLISPPLATPAYAYEWLSADVTATGLATVGLQWATSGLKGLHGQVLEARPGRHTYNVRCGVDRSWVGAVSGLGLELSGERGASAQVHGLGLYEQPQGPADLRTVYLGPVEGQPRADRRFHLAWVIENAGGAEAHDVQVSLDTGGASLLRPSSRVAVARLDFGVPEVLTWELQAHAPVQVVLRAEYGGRELAETLRIAVSPGLEAEPWAAVAPPQVAKGPANPLLATLYRPPPPTALGPTSLVRRLYQRPYLGDYGPQPEVMDWQIKWCREHGLGAWIFEVGAEAPGGAPPEALRAFLGATYAPQMQFCLRWTDPTPIASGGQQLFRRDLAQLLARPNYLRLGGRPVVLVANSLVSGPAGPGLADLRELASGSGLALVACLSPGVAGPAVLRQGGYVASTDLGAARARPSDPGLVEEWEATARAGQPQVLSLQPALQYGVTPSRLKTLVQVARLVARRGDSQALPLVIVGDWNGPQGIEPRRPVGFAYLEAVREAVGLPALADFLPEDVGLGPYDRKPSVAPDHWEFEAKDSWTSAMGLSVLRIANGQLTARTDTDSPALFGGDTVLDTRRYDSVAVGLAVSAGTEARLWWRTSLRKFVRQHSLPFAVTADGAVHEYRLQVSGAAGWRGQLEGLRLDPTNAAGASVALDYVRVLPRQ